MTDVDPELVGEEEEEVKVDPVAKAPELYEALKDSNIALAFSLLAEEVPPSHCDTVEGYTCLYWAVKCANIKLIKTIIEKGGSSHYHHAKKMKMLDPSADVQEDLTIKFLLNSPLLAAAYAGYMNTTWVLLADGFSPDDTDLLGNSAVHLAAAAGHIKILNVLIADGAEINVFNKFRNIPADIAITKETHDLLVAEKERRDANMSYSGVFAHNELQKKHAKISSDLINAIADVSGCQPSDLTDNVTDTLTSAMESAEQWDIDGDLVEEARILLIRVQFTQDLNKTVANIIEKCPIRQQCHYVEYVTNLESMVERAEAAGVDRSGLQSSRDLIVRCQIEYWLSTSVDRMKDVDKAQESNEHDILRLKACIQKAEALGASDALIDEAASRLLQLETELEMSRAVDTYQKERLPIDNAPSDYWKPCDIGHIEETAEYPMLPEGSSEYIWEPSAAHKRVKFSLDRLKKCLVGIESSRANELLVTEVKDKIVKAEKDFKILDIKDAEDKKKAVDSATKAAKKLKKAKKAAAAKK